MSNLDSILKSRDITLPTKVHLVKAIVFPVVMYGCESWTVKQAERRRLDAFELWCWRRLLRVPWTVRRSNQSILKEINPGISLEGIMLKLKLQYLGHLMWRVYSKSCSLSWWCHPTISSSVVPFSSLLQSFPASGSFQMCQFFTSGGQSIGSFSSSISPSVNIHYLFPLRWTGWIFLQSKGVSRVFSNTTVQKHKFFWAQLSLQSNSHIHTRLLEKP